METATRKLIQDYLLIQKEPLPFITAHPLPSNILEWHYVIKGPPESPYEGGYYHGKLVFPDQFPFRPPAIYMLTPNGRFKINYRLCLSISDYHPENWNPSWTVSGILTYLFLFMLETTITNGSIESSLKEKKALAKVSGDFNLKNDIFYELFLELVVEIYERNNYSLP